MCYASVIGIVVVVSVTLPQISPSYQNLSTPEFVDYGDNSSLLTGHEENVTKLILSSTFARFLGLPENPVVNVNTTVKKTPVIVRPPPTLTTGTNLVKEYSKLAIGLLMFAVFVVFTGEMMYRYLFAGSNRENPFNCRRCCVRFNRRPPPTQPHVLHQNHSRREETLDKLRDSPPAEDPIQWSSSESSDSDEEWPLKAINDEMLINPLIPEGSGVVTRSLVTASEPSSCIGGMATSDENEFIACCTPTSSFTV